MASKTEFEALQALRDDALARGHTELAIACGNTAIRLGFELLALQIKGLPGRPSYFKAAPGGCALRLPGQIPIDAVMPPDGVRGVSIPTTR